MKIIDKVAWLYIRQGKILFARSKGQEVCYLPGGKREPGEADAQTLSREILEELSVRIKPDTMEHFGTFEAQAHGKSEGVTVRMTCYTADYEGELRPSSEIEELVWLSADDRARMSPVCWLIMDRLQEPDKKLPGLRKVIVFNSITLDGFYAGQNGELDWMPHDREVEAAAHERMTPDTILFGGTTYRMFEGFWPGVLDNPAAPEGLRATAEELGRMSKIVFSRAMADVSWENSTLIKDDPIEAVKRLKQVRGGDITVFGSGSLIRQLAQADLVDELLLILVPVVLGSGKSFFHSLPRRELELLDSRSFGSGAMLLHYRVRR